VAKVYQLCSSPQAQAGGYFAWENLQNAAVVIKAETGQNWPLVQSQPVVITGNSTTIVQVIPGQPVANYPISVTFQQGGSVVCPTETTPVIIVTAPPEPKAKYR
jgi:hypothetical protein